MPVRQRPPPDAVSVRPAPVVTEILGRFRNASNATLLARTGDGGLVVYKPEQGERPLWDFTPGTLAAREVLTYRVSQEAGLGVVPETVFADGPFGPGSAQRYVEANPGFDAARPINDADPRLWPIAVLDLLVNNADRKAGHFLLDEAGRLWCIDHGVTFHFAAKLRTVLWNFAERELPEEMTGAVRRLRDRLPGGLYAEVLRLLGKPEADALMSRADDLLENPVHPPPPVDRPPVPWPVW